PVHAWQDDVEYDQRRRLDGDLLERVLTVYGGNHAVALLLQQRGGQLPVGRAVVNNKHSFFHDGFPASGSAASIWRTAAHSPSTNTPNVARHSSRSRVSRKNVPAVLP